MWTEKRWLACEILRSPNTLSSFSCSSHRLPPPRPSLYFKDAKCTRTLFCPRALRTEEEGRVLEHPAQLGVYAGRYRQTPKGPAAAAAYVPRVTDPVGNAVEGLRQSRQRLVTGLSPQCLCFMPTHFKDTVRGKCSGLLN